MRRLCGIHSMIARANIAYTCLQKRAKRFLLFELSLLRFGLLHALIHDLIQSDEFLFRVGHQRLFALYRTIRKTVGVMVWIFGRQIEIVCFDVLFHIQKRVDWLFLSIVRTGDRDRIIVARSLLLTLSCMLESQSLLIQVRLAYVHGKLLKPLFRLFFGCQHHVVFLGLHLPSETLWLDLRDWLGQSLKVLSIRRLAQDLLVRHQLRLELRWQLLLALVVFGFICRCLP